LNPYIGYANATAIAREAHASGRGVYELVLEKGLLPKEKLEEVLRPEALTQPHAMAELQAQEPVQVGSGSSGPTPQREG
jgi:aspartate ammonia-lyase